MKTSPTEDQFYANMSLLWKPLKIFLVSLFENPIAKPLTFLIDSGADITYISEQNAKLLGYTKADCKFNLTTSGISKSSEELCVAEITIVIDEEEYHTFAQTNWKFKDK